MPIRRAIASLSLLLLLGGPARAVPLPNPIAEADATARYQDSGVGSHPVFSGFGGTFADQLAIAAGPSAGNFAIANGTGVISDPDFGASVDGFAEIRGAGSFPGAIDPTVAATSYARSRTVWEVAPGPAGPVDVDLDLALHGAFEVANFFSNDGRDVFAQVRYSARVYDDTGSELVFEGWVSALGAFRNDSVSTAFDFDPSIVTRVPPLGSFSTSRFEVAYAGRVEDALTLAVGDRFAVEIVLTTDVHAAGPFEMHALADFEDTGLFALASSTPGASFTAVPVPEPDTAALVLASLLLLAACGSPTRPVSAPASSGRSARPSRRP
jgi:hypothetical protein